jgi:hypothetical protein
METSKVPTCVLLQTMDRCRRSRGRGVTVVMARIARDAMVGFRTMAGQV